MPFSTPSVKVTNSSKDDLIVHIEGIRLEPFYFIRIADISIFQKEKRDIIMDHQILFSNKSLVNNIVCLKYLFTKKHGLEFRVYFIILHYFQKNP